LLRTFNISEVPLTSKAHEPADMEPKPESIKPDEQTKLEPAVVDVTRSHNHKSFTADQRRAIWKSFDTKAASGESGFITIVNKLSAAQNALVSETYKSLIKDHPIEEAVKLTLEKCFGAKADEYVRDGLAPAWLSSMKSGFDHANEILGGGADFNLVNPLFTEWVKTNGLLKAEGINETTNEKLRARIALSLGEGIDSGETMTQLKQRVLDATDSVYEDMDANRAKMIARTETMSSVNFGAVETYRSDGVEQKQWLSTIDDRTRDDHVEADGQTVGINEDFEVGGDTMDAPGNGGDPAENIYCRCTVIPDIPEGD